MLLAGDALPIVSHTSNLDRDNSGVSIGRYGLRLSFLSFAPREESKMVVKLE